MKPPFKNALPILNKMEEAGFEAYFVGGSVRDLLLNREIDDVDIATSATPEEVKAIFPKTIDVGIEHGTVVVLYNGESYEMTTFRSESKYEDFRRPSEVFFIRSLKEDLQRRDFTINAIAMDKNGQLRDPFNGQDAIKKKLITTVGCAKERFHEDALRMMRAVRFVSQLSFSIEELTLGALKEHGQLLEHIAVERKTVEFEKLLLGPNYQEALNILLKTGIYQYLPGLSKHYDGLRTFLQKKLHTPFSIEEIWIILLNDLQLKQREAEDFLRTWKHSTKKIKRIKQGLFWLKYRLNDEWTKEKLYEAQEELVMSTEKIYQTLMEMEIESQFDSLKEQLQLLPIKERSDLDVTGKDLMEWYDLRGGPWIEEKLQEIEKAVIHNKLNNCKESIREWLFSCNQP